MNLSLLTSTGLLEDLGPLLCGDLGGGHFVEKQRVSRFGVVKEINLYWVS